MKNLGKIENPKDIITKEYLEQEILAITSDEIDEICGTTIELAEDVKL